MFLYLLCHYGAYIGFTNDLCDNNQGITTEKFMKHIEASGLNIVTREEW